MIANVFKPNLLCNKTTFFCQGSISSYIAQSTRYVQYFLDSYIMSKPVTVYQIFVNGERGCMIILDQIDSSLSDINQRSFYFLILPDSSSGLFVVIRPTSQLSSLSLQCCVAIGFASQSIPGMKAFQFGLEMRFFFLLILRGLQDIWESAKKLVIVKCSVRTIRQQYNGERFLIINYCFIINLYLGFLCHLYQRLLELYSYFYFQMRNGRKTNPAINNFR